MNEPENTEDNIEEMESLRTFDTINDQIIEIEGLENKDDKMLPVHFLPEGRKCYDWVNSDVRENQDQKKPKHTNTLTYTSASMMQPSLTDNNESTMIQTLLSSAENNDLETVQNILSKQPLLVNRTDSDGYTALHRACYSGHRDIVLYLIKHGANIFAQTNDGWQPIHCAARWNQLEVCKILLENNIDINATTNGGQTPLHLTASSISSKKLLEMFLLQPFIETDIKNSAGDTAYDLAYRNGPQYKLFDLADDCLKI